MPRVMSTCVVVCSMVVSLRIAHARCEGRINRNDVVRCAFESSRELRVVRNELGVLAGERRTAGTLLPSNPVVSVSVGGRRLRNEPANASTRAINWYVALQQEIEIAGQRGTRLAVVDAQTEAQQRRIAAAERTIAAEALVAYFDLLEAEASIALTAELGRVGEALERSSDARVQEGLVSPLDADLARAEALRLRTLSIEAQRRRTEAGARLAALIAGDPTAGIEVAGQLTTELPPEDALAVTLGERLSRGIANREDIAVARLEQVVADRVITRARRGRIPNPTLSFGVQNDGFDELVLIGGITFPIPLPSPVGQTKAGEIASARASRRRTELESEITARTVKLEIVAADAAARATRAELRLYTQEIVDRSRAHLRALADAAGGRQMNIRDALLAQRTLIDLLQSAIAAQHGWAVAWVELERASGSPLLAAIGGVK